MASEQAAKSPAEQTFFEDPALDRAIAAVTKVYVPPDAGNGPYRRFPWTIVYAEKRAS